MGTWRRKTIGVLLCCVVLLLFSIVALILQQRKVKSHITNGVVTNVRLPQLRWAQGEVIIEVVTKDGIIGESAANRIQCKIGDKITVIQVGVVIHPDPNTCHK